jgi:hypothetical protein
MMTVSFDAMLEGDTIKVPARYAKQIKTKVKVVLLTQSEGIGDKRNTIPFCGFDTTGYKFDREEANER